MINDQADDRSLPHESDHERTVRHRLSHLLASTPIPPAELVDNLALYLRRQPLTDLLSLNTLYRMVLEVPGVITEFGAHRGRHLAALTALRGVYEPYNPHHRIVGFDTFTGFPNVTDIDTTSPSAVAGRFALTDGYPRHLRDVLDAHEQGEHLGHIRRTLIVQGDVHETLPRYLADNPHTVIALAYFDLDLYEPTRDTIDAIRPYLTKDSVLAFDELAHAKWPGETAALREHSAPTTPPCARCPAAPPPPTGGGAPSGSADRTYLDQQRFPVGEDELLQRGRLQVDRHQIVSAQVNPVQLIAAPRRIAELGTAAGRLIQAQTSGSR